MEYALARQGNKALDYYRDKYYVELRDMGINPDIEMDCVATLSPSIEKVLENISMALHRRKVLKKKCE